MSRTSYSGKPVNEERLLRLAALWAADCADMALAVFEGEECGDNRPRDAIVGARKFGHGGPRNKVLRNLAWAAHVAAKESDAQFAKYAARSAMLAAAVAFTHIDLKLGSQGVRQARHVLGPAVYAALACEVASESQAGNANNVLQIAADIAPAEVGFLLLRFPPQPQGSTRLGKLFHHLDTNLSSASAR
jgi:hypothetical protein